METNYVNPLYSGPLYGGRIQKWRSETQSPEWIRLSNVAELMTSLSASSDIYARIIGGTGSVANKFITVALDTGDTVSMSATEAQRVANADDENVTCEAVVVDGVTLPVEARIQLGPSDIVEACESTAILSGMCVSAIEAAMSHNPVQYFANMYQNVVPGMATSVQSLYHGLCNVLGKFSSGGMSALSAIIEGFVGSSESGDQLIHDHSSLVSQYTGASPVSVLLSSLDLTLPEAPDFDKIQDTLQQNLQTLWRKTLKANAAIANGWDQLSCWVGRTISGVFMQENLEGSLDQGDLPLIDLFSRHGSISDQVVAPASYLQSFLFLAGSSKFVIIPTPCGSFIYHLADGKLVVDLVTSLLPGETSIALQNGFGEIGNTDRDVAVYLSRRNWAYKPYQDTFGSDGAKYNYWCVNRAHRAMSASILFAAGVADVQGRYVQDTSDTMWRSNAFSNYTEVFRKYTDVPDSRKSNRAMFEALTAPLSNVAVSQAAWLLSQIHANFNSDNTLRGSFLSTDSLPTPAFHVPNDAEESRDILDAATALMTVAGVAIGSYYGFKAVKSIMNLRRAAARDAARYARILGDPDATPEQVAQARKKSLVSSLKAGAPSSFNPSQAFVGTVTTDAISQKVTELSTDLSVPIAKVSESLDTFKTDVSNDLSIPITKVSESLDAFKTDISTTIESQAQYTRRIITGINEP